MTDARAPLERARLATSRWPVAVMPTVDSTNAEVARRWRRGEPVAAGGLCLVAEEQTAGRGRLDRGWEVPAGAALTVSFLLAPGGVEVEAARWPWLPLLTGLAVHDAVREQTGLPVRLKWPNDVLAGSGKLAGILTERVEGPAGAAAVLGVGLNVSQRREELPVETATSLALELPPEVPPPDRVSLLLAIGAALDGLLELWRRPADAARLHERYAAACATVGQTVRVQQPTGETLTGTATRVAGDGRLVVVTEDGFERVLGAGDVVHVRPA